MNNIDITLSFNELRLNALREYLEPLGFSIELQLQKTFDEFYESMIPEEERDKISAQGSCCRRKRSVRLPKDCARLTYGCDIGSVQILTFSIMRC